MSEGLEFSYFRHHNLEYLATEYSEVGYHYDKEGETWVIEEIESDKPGMGKTILREFVRRVGNDQPVRVIGINESETRKALAEMGILPRVEQTQKSFELRDPDAFKTLKMCRLLTGGGIDIDKIVFTPVPKDRQEDWPEKNRFKVEIEILGKTRSQSDSVQD
ncbi:hypothetical protein HQ584_05570 [Patescibacteria group bacterium]|nr:hypothetical protein [Patescibacteria group bacterium]